MLSQVYDVTANEKRLIKHLLENYAKFGTEGLPVNGTQTVDFGIGLISIEDVNEFKEQITLDVWLRFVSQPSFASSSSQDDPIDKHSTQNRRCIPYIQYQHQY